MTSGGREWNTMRCGRVPLLYKDKHTETITKTLDGYGGAHHLRKCSSMQRRKLKLKAKFERTSSYCSVKR